VEAEAVTLEEKKQEEEALGAVSTVLTTLKKQQKQWGGLVIFTGVIGAGLIAVAAIAAERTDAGVKNVEIRQTITEQGLANHLREDVDFKIRVAHQVERQNEQIALMREEMRLVLDAMKVPEWKRPAEPQKDGGP